MDWRSKLLGSPKGGAVLNSVRRQWGFSLIELMIGVAIVAILLVLAAPSYRTGMQNAQIRTAADSILNGLQLAKVEAVRRNYTVRLELATGAGWTWTVGCDPEVPDTSEDADDLPDCPGTANANPIQRRVAGEGTVNTVLTATQATGGALANPVAVAFNGVGRTNLAAGNVITFNVSNPSGGTCAEAGGNMRCLRVTVTAGGQMRMCDPALTLTQPTDVRAC